MNQERLLRRMVRENRTQSEMAATLNISTDTLRVRLRELGLIPKRGRRLPLAEVKKAYEEAGTTIGAAKLLGVSRQAVHARLAAAGVIQVKAPT